MNNLSRSKNRREFLGTAAAAAIAAPMIVPSSVLGRDGATPPSERIVLGGLGIGPRGRTDLACFLSEKDAHFISVCDAQKERRDLVKQMVDTHYGCGPNHQLMTSLYASEKKALRTFPSPTVRVAGGGDSTPFCR